MRGLAGLTRLLERMMAGVAVAAWEETKDLARQFSAVHLDLARSLAERQMAGDWPERYATLDEFVDTELKLLLSTARELLRVRRKLAAVEISSDTALEIGWDKLRTVSSKLRPDNRDAIVQDLESDTVQVIRDKYCQRPPSSRARKTACTEPEIPNCQRPILSECGAEPPAAEAEMNNPQVAVAAGTVGSEQVATQPNLALVGTTLGSRVVMSDCIAAALGVARRTWGPHEDQHLLDAICAMFVSIMGSENEKQSVLAMLLAQQAKSKSRTSKPNPIGGRASTVDQVESQPEAAQSDLTPLDPAPRAAASSTAERSAPNPPQPGRRRAASRKRRRGHRRRSRH